MKLTLNHLTSNLPMRLIDLDLRPYLERYHLAAIGNCRVWLHHFVSADADRNVHDHPWPALSIIFRGGYRELVENPDGSFDIIDRNAWSFNWIPAHKRHRIIQMKPGTWSLMLVGPRHGRGWFVYNEDGTQSHEADDARKNDWHKTAGNRAAAYEKLEQFRRAAGLSTPKHFNCRCVMQPVTKHAGDGLVYALQGTGRGAGKTAILSKMMESKNGSVLRFPDGEPIKSLADEELNRALESINRSRKNIYGSGTPPLFHDGNGHITHIGFDPASPDDLAGESATISPEVWEKLKTGHGNLSVVESDRNNPKNIVFAEKLHDETIYHVGEQTSSRMQDWNVVPLRRSPISWFEWMTRCQLELARQTNNWFGDWGPNALEAWESYPWSTPEDAATKYLNDEFTNGR